MNLPIVAAWYRIGKNPASTNEADEPTTQAMAGSENKNAGTSDKEPAANMKIVWRDNAQEWRANRRNAEIWGALRKHGDDHYRSATISQ